MGELLRYPLDLFDPQVCESRAKHVESVLRRTGIEPLGCRACRPFDLMMALVPAGFALGLAGARGELLEVMPGFRAPPMQVSLVYPNRRQRSRRLTGFIEWFEALVRPLLDL